MRKLNIAIVGATGLVGSTFIKILDEEQFQIENLYLYASSRSAGKVITFKGSNYTVIELNEENIKNKEIDYALFSAGGSVSLAYARVFTKYGAIVVDNSSAWRMNEEVPLVVPEINLRDVSSHKLIANPNCSTIQSVLPLKVIQDLYDIQDIHYTTYQAVSGSGINGIKDLQKTMNGEEPSNYKYPIYNNVLPQIDVFLENGYTKEEIKMILETKKILHTDASVSATCVRVPVENSHSVSITVTLSEELNLNKIRSAFESFEGIKVIDDIKNEEYPLPTFATNTNPVYVGRIRKDYQKNNVLHFFCVADNIRKGAALNAVQIVKALEKRSESHV